MECAFTYFIILMPTEEKLDASARLSPQTEAGTQRERRRCREGQTEGTVYCLLFLVKTFVLFLAGIFGTAPRLGAFVISARLLCRERERENVGRGESRGEVAMAYKCRRRVGEQFTRLHLKDMRKTF